MTRLIGIPDVGVIGATDEQTMRDINCAGWTRIDPSRNDTDLTIDQIVAHNEFGIKQGCWEARN